MSKQNVVVVMMFILSVILPPPIQSSKLSAGKWAKSFPRKNQETETNLKFYVHEMVEGENPSAVKVAERIDKIKADNDFDFGEIWMTDAMLTEEREPESKLVGRAQGIYAWSGQHEPGLLMSLSYSFVDGPYNGSTFALVGKNSVTNPVREMPVVGGTGRFRMARGYAIAETPLFDLTSNETVVGYNVTLFHQS